MYKKWISLLPILVLGITTPASSNAQEWSLNAVLKQAHISSIQAIEAKQSFIATYWSWKAYQASLLPSFFMYGNLMNYDRSLILLQDTNNGIIKYVGSHHLQNGMGLMISQIIPWTGGTATVYSDINRIDQFVGSIPKTWYAQPVTFSYNQPLFAYNAYKWDRKIAPKAYEEGRRSYLEAMEQVNIDATEAFFSLLEAQEQEKSALQNLDDSRELLSIAEDRFHHGFISRNDYLQVELRMLNDSLSIQETRRTSHERRMVLNSLLGREGAANIAVKNSDTLPTVLLDYEAVLLKATENSSFFIRQDVQLLKARSAVDKAKTEGGINMSFSARFGLSKSGVSLMDAYADPLDQEIVGLHFSIPIFDWGLSRGKVQKARAAEELVLAQAEQDRMNYQQRVFSFVNAFNQQRGQCRVSRRAMEIAQERHLLLMEAFKTGETTVWELNTARNEMDAAKLKYIRDVGLFWKYYYTLRKTTLFDFLEEENININEKELIE